MAFDRLEDEAFWRELAPDLTISATPARTIQLLSPNEAARERMLGVFDREGYIQLPRTQELAPMARLASLVETIRAAGLPPVFGFVYDAMWEPYRRLGAIIGSLLRGPHAIMPSIWAWHVDPGKGEAGWTPHRDRRENSMFPDGRPKALTVWIPLTEATTLNGCMYVIPKHRDSEYGNTTEVEATNLLADIRALPATPGDSLIWTQELLHWGSRTSEMGTAPRISMSVEFQRLDQPALAGFVMRPELELTFQRKLALIGHGIVGYRHMHALEGELVDVAQRWRSSIPALFGLSADLPVRPGLPGAGQVAPAR